MILGYKENRNQTRSDIYLLFILYIYHERVYRLKYYEYCIYIYISYL